MPRDLAPLYPESFAAVFPARRCSGKPDGDWPRSYTATVDLADVTLTVPDTVKPRGVPGTTHAVRSTAVALYSTAAGDPTNRAALDDLAAALAQDFYDRRSVSFDTVYNGIIGPKPHGLLDLITWDYTAEDQATRLQSQPWVGDEVEFQHQDPAISGCQDSESTPVDDRTPGVLVDVPGGGPGQSMRAVLAIEGGRLVERYDRTATLDCGCATACGSVCVTVIGCNNLKLAGANVTVTLGGVTIGSGVTGGTNTDICFDITTGGTYTINVTESTGRFQSATQNTILASCSDRNVSITLTPSSGYICVPCPGFAYPIARTLHYSTPGGNSGTTTCGTSAVWFWDEVFSGIPCCDVASGTVTISWSFNGFPANCAVACGNLKSNCSSFQAECLPASDSWISPTSGNCGAIEGARTLTAPGPSSAFVLTQLWSRYGVFDEGTLTLTE